MPVLRLQLCIVLATAVAALALVVLSPVARGVPDENVVDEGPAGAPYASGELLVVYEEEVEAEEQTARALNAASGGEVEDDLSEIDADLLEFPEVKAERSQEAREADLARIKAELEEDPAVESVEYNYLDSIFYTPDDPRFGAQYGLKKPGFPTAWDRTRGKRRKIAVVDSGASVTHPDLRRKIYAKYDFRNENRTVEDMVGHGTHVAGTMAARTGNGIGVAGGCPQCRLIIAKAIGEGGSGYVSDIAQGIIWSANQGAKAINLSVGSTSDSETRRRAVNYATKKGAVVIAAAGNSGINEPVYPAAYRNVMAVAATGPKDGRSSGYNSGAWVDVSAPGFDIVSTVPGGGYAYKSGTSMAAPHVTALAGLLASQGRGPASIRKRILRTAVDLGPSGRDPYYGAGRINAERATRR